MPVVRADSSMGNSLETAASSMAVRMQTIYNAKEFDNQKEE
jgi:hypothetical protein